MIVKGEDLGRAYPPSQGFPHYPSQVYSLYVLTTAVSFYLTGHCSLPFLAPFSLFDLNAGAPLGVTLRHFFYVLFLNDNLSSCGLKCYLYFKKFISEREKNIDVRVKPISCLPHTPELGIELQSATFWYIGQCFN